MVVIIASATIDQETFIGHFGGHEKVPFIESEGRFFPVTKRWWGGLVQVNDQNLDETDDWYTHVNGGELPERELLPEAIADLVEYLCKTLDGLSPVEKAKRDGHILVFLPGTREIDRTVALVTARRLPNVLALPLYATRPLDEQDRALDPKNERDRKMRRVVVSTNVAETSLTVEGVKYVIDSGYIKTSYWNPLSEITELQTVRHSQAGCRQRWGRAGRVAPGDAYMLYTKEQFDQDFPPHTSPDIARSSLEQVLLTALAAGVHDVHSFGWMPLKEEKDRLRFHSELERALEALKAKGAIDEQKRDLTTFGLELRGLPTALDIATVFAEGDRHALGVEVATLLPFLKLEHGLLSVLKSDPDENTYTELAVRQHHLAIAYGCRDDLDIYLKLWMIWESLSRDKREKWCSEAGIDYKIFKERIEDERRKLIGSIMDWRKAEQRPILIEKMDALRVLIAFCLQKEIYVPLETDDRENRDLEFLNWESHYDEADQYEEYEDNFDFDASLAAGGGPRTNTGVFRRYNVAQQAIKDADVVEIAPISLCSDQPDLSLIVVCQRRANFMRPARAKTLAVNIVRLEPEWLSVLQATRVGRTVLYAGLSRRTDAKAQRMRLFLPWVVPLAAVVVAQVEGVDPDRGYVVKFTAAPSGYQSLTGLSSPVVLQGFLDEPAASPQLRAGDTVELQVTGYGLDYGKLPCVLLSRYTNQHQAFVQFKTRYQIGSAIEVEMVRILEDPLKRRPMFVVRELKTGFEMPMSAGDFCGSTIIHPYFGLRFQPGESFHVDVVDILVHNEEVTLSRARYLLEEYAQVPADIDRRIIDVEVVRVDDLGVYLAIPGRSPRYISFVRRALLPAGVRVWPGERVRARLRRYERALKLDKWKESIESGEALPTALDFGIELDLRVPIAYDRFRERNQIGDLITLTVERQLDNGSLLVDIGSGLKAIIYDSELGLDEQGNLRTSRAFEPTIRVDVLIYNMKDETASVQCSIWRVTPIADLGLAINAVIDARVLQVRADHQGSERRYVTCSYADRYRVSAICDNPELDLREGEMIKVVLTRVDERIRDLRGQVIDE